MLSMAAKTLGCVSILALTFFTFLDVCNQIIVLILAEILI